MSRDKLSHHQALELKSLLHENAEIFALDDLELPVECTGIVHHFIDIGGNRPIRQQHHCTANTRRKIIIKR